MPVDHDPDRCSVWKFHYSIEHVWTMEKEQKNGFWAHSVAFLRAEATFSGWAFWAHFGSKNESLTIRFEQLFICPLKFSKYSCSFLCWGELWGLRLGLQKLHVNIFTDWHMAACSLETKPSKNFKHQGLLCAWMTHIAHGFPRCFILAEL